MAVRAHVGQPQMPTTLESPLHRVVATQKQVRLQAALQRLHDHAATLGGQCLSSEYSNTRAKVRWRCRFGHEWLAAPGTALRKKGSWCPECAIEEKKLGLKSLKDHARSLGGVCLADSYTNVYTKVSWQCKFGHEWQAKPSNILYQKSWCPQCFRDSQRAPGSTRRKIDLQTLREHASTLGGMCLADEYLNLKSKLVWQCACGHTWQASAGNVLNGKSWCPQCSQTRPLRLKLLRDHAAALKGQCLATKYINNSSKLWWQCRHGHEWQATPANILNKGTWCPHCAKRAPIGLPRLQAHAASLGGLCLAESYQNVFRKMTWMCRHGHVWSASANSVLNSGTWCPDCATKTSRAESEVRRIFEDIFSPASFGTCFPSFLEGLQLDGHSPEMQLGFEYQGEQHYRHDHFFHSRDPQSFQRQCERDARKVKLCQSAGVRLVVIPYFVRDKRTFIQLALLQWFTISEVNPVMLGTKLSRD